MQATTVPSVAIKTLPHKKNGRINKSKEKKSFKMFLLILPFMILLALFAYYPLFGWVYAFFDYKAPYPLSSCDFVGFKWFVSLFANDTKRRIIGQVFSNTFALSGLSIVTSWLPMAFAVFMAEIKTKWFKKIVQTITTLPNFISWVLVYSMAFSIFSSSGMMNTLLQNLGIISSPIAFLDSDSHTWLSMWLWTTWKGLGWSAIIYLAALSGIDQELYEAARVDGAGRFRLMWNITVPGLMPTFFVLLLLGIANFLNNGMDQYYVFQNAFNKKHIEVLDLYVYNIGLGSGSYSLATAVSIMKSIVSLTLLLSVNGLSKSFRGETIV